MSLFITSLNSGSNGNCYYVGNQNEAILVDAGISCREIEKRMKRLGLDMQNVKAIFVSHEHTDHIKGIPSLAKKFQLPVYITEPTLLHGRLMLEPSLVVNFIAHQPIAIGNLSITAFPKFHDASDPYSFIVDCNNIKVGIFTDIGAACKNVIHHFKQCHAAFLEANYDEDMLNNGNYPYFLKKRICGGSGHLSNKEAFDLFTKHRPPYMSHLLLSHLSHNNNCPKLVHELFTSNAQKVKVVVASRYQETEVYHINADHNTTATIKKKITATPQLSFAFA
ncbi:MAG: Phosphoribosyl 1,2-cyclic phosphodiesterase [Segetibacter sp.]|nr:Phosphoribosyl 1,2-cyclic phosphodiesterase [Segetibacter sp.]